jgi:hypothetical protein
MPRLCSLLRQNHSPMFGGADQMFRDAAASFSFFANSAARHDR